MGSELPERGMARLSAFERAAVRDLMRRKLSLVGLGIDLPFPMTLSQLRADRAMESAYLMPRPQALVPPRTDVLMSVPTFCGETRSARRWLYEASQAFRCDEAQAAAHAIGEGADLEDVKLAWTELLRFIRRDLKVGSVIPAAAIRTITAAEGEHLELFHTVPAAIKLLQSGAWRKADPDQRAAYLRAALLNEARHNYISQLKEERRFISTAAGERDGNSGLSELSGGEGELPNGIIVRVDLQHGLGAIKVTPDQRRLILARFEGMRLTEAPDYLGWSPRRLAVAVRGLAADREPGRALRDHFAKGYVEGHHRRTTVVPTTKPTGKP